MFRLWIVVANKTRARIFEYTGRVSGMKLIKTLENPDGRLRDQEIARENAHERVAVTFAHELAVELDRSRHQGKYNDLILVAEPGFLGKLKAELKKETADRVVAVHQRNLGEIEERELSDHLLPVVEDYNPLLSGAMT